MWIFLLGCSFASWSSCTTGMFCLIYITPEQQPYGIKESSNSSKVIFQLLVSIVHDVSHILFRHKHFSVLRYWKFHTIGGRSNPQDDSPSEQNTALPKSGSNRQIQQLLRFLAISALNLQEKSCSVPTCKTNGSNLKSVTPLQWASSLRVASSSSSGVTVRCSTNSHFPPFYTSKKRSIHHRNLFWLLFVIRSTKNRKSTRTRWGGAIVFCLIEILNKGNDWLIDWTFLWFIQLMI